ncbi:hypothetical protein [Kribbella sindirgiensis]|uniref:Neutral/alkaline non-lysosomal ceramidase N-terminal domain-containing protein n=1 Tax=Kribbella sindirgiensis TaxID=1124744 RepID=A0A4R0IDA4_9ACTN|nr:hypothetical protein [Kribbella sindirgiensis]TCC21619.1 hypothetical protein E0H50_35655 [Kribbella sindirgiensis]
MMQVGAAAIDITPAWPIPLAGFGSRQGTLATEVADPLFLRVTVLASGGTGAAVVAADLLSWGPELVDRLRPLVAETLSVPADCITFTATHTHSAPQTALWHAPILGRADPRYLEFLTDRVLAASAAAVTALEPVTVRRASRAHDLGSYRRADVEDGPRDDELTTVTFRRADGSLLAAWVHYTCHPVINAANTVTPDFAGLACLSLEAETGGVISYLQGCCGDQNPGSFAYEGVAAARREGARLADTIRKTMADEGGELSPTAISASWSTVELPFRSVPTEDELRVAGKQPGAEGEWGRWYLAHPERLAPTASLALQRLDLLDGLSLLAINAEVCVEYGLAVRAAAASRYLPVAYANGIIGYLPTAAQIRAGGYEPVESARCYLLPGLFAPEIEDLTLAEIRRML